MQAQSVGFVATRKTYGDKTESFIDFSKLVPALCEAVGGADPEWEGSWRGHGKFRLGDLTIFVCHADNSAVGRVWRRLPRISAVALSMKVPNRWPSFGASFPALINSFLA